MRRRVFIITSGEAALALLVAASLEGCDPVDELETIVPEAIEAVEEIAVIVNPPAGTALAVLFAALPGLWTAVKATITEYKSTNPPPVGTLAKVLTALSDLSDNLAQVVQSLPVSIPGVEVSLIVLGLKLTIATINWFVQKKTTGTTGMTATGAVHAHPLTVRSANVAQGVKCATDKKSYVQMFNAIKLKRRDGSVVVLK